MADPEPDAGPSPAPPGPNGPALAEGLQVEPLTERVGLKVSGEINVRNRDAWETLLDRLPATGSDIHLDLSELRMVDAGGAAALAATAQQLGPGHRVVLHDPPWALRRILNLLWPSAEGIEVSAP